MTRRQELLSVLAFSLAVTAAGAVIAGAVDVVADVDFLLAFVLIRWTVVMVLLVAPIAHRLLLRWSSVRLPYVMQTPLTALLLTVESICFDILSAQL